MDFFKDAHDVSLTQIQILVEIGLTDGRIELLRNDINVYIK